MDVLPPRGGLGIDPLSRIGRAAWTASPSFRPVVLGTVLVLALIGGLAVRSKAWRATDQIRYKDDLTSAFRTGVEASEVGYLRFYEDSGLPSDYAPLRLLVVTTWTRWLRATYPDAPADGWRRRYVQPLLKLNIVAQLTAAVGLFLLVRRWTGGVAGGGGAGGAAPSVVGRRTQAGARPAFIAALALWFNPAVIWNAHVYPQWDTWLLPFFVFALLAASAHRWFCAGALVAAGAMFKGQILLVAPVFLAWPLFSRQWGAALRWAAGFASVGTLLVSPWLLRSWTGALWVASVLAAFAALCAARTRRKRWWAVAAALALGTLWPWMLTPRGGLAWGLAVAAALLGAARVAPVGQRAAAAALLLALALLVAAVDFEGSFRWYHVGFAQRVAAVNSLRHPSVTNLALILSRRWGWRGRHPLWQGEGGPAWLPAVEGPSLRLTLALAYAATLLLCGQAAARQARRQDPRFLIAVTAPWVLMFALLPGMHQRYLVWGSGLTAAGVPLGALPAAVHLVVTAVGWGMMAHTQLDWRPEAAPGLLKVLRWLYPETGGWVLLGCSAVLLILALRPRRRLGAADGAAASSANTS